MRFRHLVFTVGLVLLAFAPAFFLTAAVAWGYGDGDVVAFLVGGAVTAGVGALCVRTTRLEGSLSIREGYAVVSFTWIAVGVLGAVPYVLSGVVTDPVAALFESVSGFTTTGSSVIADVESVPHGILFWRSLTQWMGGMGIILLGVAILPFLGVGGMHLFRAEVPGPTPERLSPRIAETAKLLWYIYAGLTVALALLLLVGGLTPFEAVNHALTTMPTGGFSTWNASLAATDSAFVHYTVVLFMYLGGVNFVLHYRAATGRPLAYVRSLEWRFYTGALVAGVVGVFVLVQAADVGGLGIERNLRDSLFQVVSVGTTTGFATADYGVWPPGAQLLLVGLMLMGGMAGSTAGGMKTMRVNVIVRSTMAELRRNLHPRAVVVSRVGDKVLEESDVLNIAGFILLFLAIFAFGALGLAFLGHDPLTALGAAASAIGNVGPGLGAVGPAENFGWMGPGSHLLLIVLMIVGRLEVFTVLLLFHPHLWRR